MQYSRRNISSRGISRYYLFSSLLFSSCDFSLCKILSSDISSSDVSSSMRSVVWYFLFIVIWLSVVTGYNGWITTRVDIAEIVISYRDHKTKMFLFLGSVEGILTCSASTVLTVSEKSFISQKIVVDVRPFLVGDKVQSTKFEFFFFLWYLAQLCLAYLPDKFSRLFCLGRTWQSWKNKKMDFYFLFCSSQGTIERDKVNKDSNFVLCFCTPTRNALTSMFYENYFVTENVKSQKFARYY